MNDGARDDLSKTRQMVSEPAYNLADNHAHNQLLESDDEDGERHDVRAAAP